MGHKRALGKVEPRKPDEPAHDGPVVARLRGFLHTFASRLKTLKGAIVALAAVGAILGGFAGYWNAYQAARVGTQSSKLLALVGKGDAGPLSIVVLPFANLTGDPQQAYVADGLTAAVTADLSRIRDAFVVSATTAFAYKDKPVTTQQIGAELGVRFALQGGVQRSGDKIRINAQLADTSTNAQVWSASFDGNHDDLFGLQELVTARIGNSIGRQMVIVSARASETRKGDPTVADLLLRARALGQKPQSLRSFAERQDLCDKALAIEPNNPQALVCLALSLAIPAYNRFISDPVIREKQLVEARDLALKAKQIDASIPGLYAVLQYYAATHGDHEAAKYAAETALSLDSKNPSRYVNLAITVGDPSRAIELLSQGISLNPRDVPGSLLYNMGLFQFAVGEYDAAIQWMLKALDTEPEFDDAYITLAKAYALRGDAARARAAYATLLRTQPSFRLAALAPKPAAPTVERDFWEKKLLPAWRFAGLPE